jgi:glycosyltransferase involved in cell wall biosynthesis
MNSSKTNKLTDVVLGYSMAPSTVKSESQISNEAGSNVTAEVLSNLSFVIVSHVAFTGHAQELETFLKRRSHKLMFIGHPFSYAHQKKSTATMYEQGKLQVKVEAPQIKGLGTLLYLKDFLVTFSFLLKFKSKFHIYVGVDPLNALAGLLLKRLGFVKIVIFYVIDYVPVRFKNTILNSIYHSIDRICVYNADYTWNLTSKMADAREKRGVKKEKTNQITVPTGTHFEKTKQLPFRQVERTNVAFISHLREGQGIELILEALPEVVEKIPYIKLAVIGTGPLEDYFKEEVQRRNLDNNVVFLGYIESHNEIERIISKCGVGLAPYVPDPNSFTWYADPGKPKVYLGCGIPVIITKVPEVAFEIDKWGAGIAIDYDKHELVDAIIKLLINDEVYCQCRQKALEFASKYTWDDIYYGAFNQMLTAIARMTVPKIVKNGFYIPFSLRTCS